MVGNYIRTKCGLAKYHKLRRNNGLVGRLRLYWFLFFGALRDAGKKKELERTPDLKNELSAPDGDVRIDKWKNLRKKVVDYLALIKYKEL